MIGVLCKATTEVRAHEHNCGNDYDRVVVCVNRLPGHEAHQSAGGHDVRGWWTSKTWRSKDIDPEIGVPLITRRCPFCGGMPSRHLTLRHVFNGPIDEVEILNGECLYVGDDDEAFCFYVRCRSCATEGPWKKSPSSAVHAWNTDLEQVYGGGS